MNQICDKIVHTNAKLFFFDFDFYEDNAYIAARTQTQAIQLIGSVVDINTCNVVETDYITNDIQNH